MLWPKASPLDLFFVLVPGPSFSIKNVCIASFQSILQKENKTASYIFTCYKQTEHAHCAKYNYLGKVIKFTECCTFLSFPSFFSPKNHKFKKNSFSSRFSSSPSQSACPVSDRTFASGYSSASPRPPAHTARHVLTAKCN